jgi:tetratricopeptide (TPR) repeat protein
VFLNEAIKLDPNNEAALAKLAEIHFEKGRYRESAAFYERAVAADPGFTSLFVPLSIAYREIGEEEKAESMLRRAEAAGMDMGDERIGSAMRLHRAGKNAEAIAYLEKLATADPGDSEIPYHIGLIFDRAGQPDKAIESYRRAVRIQPLSPHSWFNIGAIHYNRGEYLKAIEAYTETIRIDPNNAVAYANLAGAYRQLERYVEANIQYRKAEEKGMKTPDLYSEWGFCLGKVEEWEKASQRLETARAISPSAIDDTNAGWAFYNRAQAHKRDGRQAEWAADLETARVLFRSAVEKDPTLEAAFLNLGSTLNALGLHGDAMAALTAALRLRSEWTIAMNQLGLAHRGRNELALAIKQFDRVVALEPRNAAGLFNLGSAQNAGGDKKAARKTQERLKAVDPALADRLGNVIAGKVLEEGTREIRKRIRIPGL